MTEPCATRIFMNFHLGYNYQKGRRCVFINRITLLPQQTIQRPTSSSWSFGAVPNTSTIARYGGVQIPHLEFCFEFRERRSRHLHTRQPTARIGDRYFGNGGVGGVRGRLGERVHSARGGFLVDLFGRLDSLRSQCVCAFVRRRRAAILYCVYLRATGSGADGSSKEHFRKEMYKSDSSR